MHHTCVYQYYVYKYILKEYNTRNKRLWKLYISQGEIFIFLKFYIGGLVQHHSDSTETCGTAAKCMIHL